MKRWRKGLQQIVGKFTSAMPEGWRARSVDTADESFIKERLLSQELITALGSDYMHGRKWLESLRKYDLLALRFDAMFNGELQAADKAFDDAQTIVGLVLTYNAMYVKFPKTKQKQVP